ncbi:MAG: hypothetical protein AAF419_01890, partial [Pseudomonadota bacterium]
FRNVLIMASERSYLILMLFLSLIPFRISLTIFSSDSDQVILTNDNPRTESEEKIVSDILKGIKDKNNISIKYDRSDAIINTFLNAKKDDVILIAGKGHETTQEIGSTLLPFSDRELVRRLMEGDV